MDMLKLEQPDNSSEKIKNFLEYEKQNSQKSENEFVKTLKVLQDNNKKFIETVTTQISNLNDNRERLDEKFFKEQTDNLKKLEKSAKRRTIQRPGLDKFDKMQKEVLELKREEIKNYKNDPVFEKLGKTLDNLSLAKEMKGGTPLNEKQMKQLEDVLDGSLEQFIKQFDDNMKDRTKKLKKENLEDRKKQNDAKKKDSWLFNLEGKFDNAIGKGLSKAGSWGLGKTKQVGGAAAGLTSKLFNMIPGSKAIVNSTTGKAIGKAGGFVKGGISNAVDIFKTDLDTFHDEIKQDEEQVHEDATSTKAQDSGQALAELKTVQADVNNSKEEYKTAQEKFKTEMESGTGDTTKITAARKEIAMVEQKLKNSLTDLERLTSNNIKIRREDEQLAATGYDQFDKKDLDEYTNNAQTKVENQETKLEDKLANINVNMTSENENIKGIYDFMNNVDLETLLTSAVDYADSSYLNRYFETIFSKLDTVIEYLQGSRNNEGGPMDTLGQILGPNGNPLEPLGSGGAEIAGVEDLGGALGGSELAATGGAEAGLATTVEELAPLLLADGGMIPGNSTEGDKVPALVNSGEMVLNKEQQANLFNMLGGQHFEDGGIAGTGPIQSEEQLDSMVGLEDQYTASYQENQQQRMDTDQQVFDFKQNLQQAELQNKQEANNQEMAMTNKMTLLEKAAAMKEKAIMVGEAIATTAESVGKAFAMGQVDPFAINATIQAAIAGVMGATQIATIAGVGFKEGGVVPGESYEGDKVLARVNSGEIILNQKQQDNLFNAIDNAEQFAGGGVAGGGKSQSEIMKVADDGKKTMNKSTESLDKLAVFADSASKQMDKIINTIKDSKPTLVTRIPGKQYPSVRFALDYSNY